MKLRMKDSSKPWSRPCGSTHTVKMRSSVEDSCAQNVCLRGRTSDDIGQLMSECYGSQVQSAQVNVLSFEPYLPRSRRYRDRPVVLGHSMLLPINNDPKHPLLHLKGLVLAEVDVQWRARLALANTLVTQVMRLAHSTETGRILDELIQNRALRGGDGGIMGRVRAMRWAGRQPLLEASWWHFWGLLPFVGF